MLTHVAPFIVYLLSYPIMFISLFRVDIGILFFITIIPIISVVKKIAEFPAGNNFADYLLISLVIGWLLAAKEKNGRIFRSSPVNGAVMLVVVGSIISLLWGSSYTSFSSDINLDRLMAWKNYMILPVIYFISINNISEEKLVRWIVILVCISMIAMDFNFYSTFRWMNNVHYKDSIRISGTFNMLGPNEMGAFYAIYTFLLLGISYFIENKKFKYFVLFTCACNFYPILFSYSRAAYMSSCAGLFALGLLKDRRIIILLAVLVLAYSYVLPKSVVERIDMTFLDQSSISEVKSQSSAIDVGGVTLDSVGRKELWEKAQGYFKQSPIIGIGFDSFCHREGMITHNMYLKILAEQGLVGMMIFIFFTVTLLKQSYKLFTLSAVKLGKGVGLGFFTCIIVYLVGSLTGDQSLYYNLMAIFWLFAGIVASLNLQFIENFEK